MASSGTITVYTESVDYPDYSRGDVTLTNVIGWSVNDSGVISFTSISSSDNVGGSWGICGITPDYGVTLAAQVSYDNGSTWSTVASAFQSAAICPSLTNTISTSITLIGSLGTAQLTGNCMLRILYYANYAPAPSSDLPNAFPDSNYSAAVQVPVNVDVNWTATLKYDANGGTGAPSNQTHTQSTNSYTFTVSNTVPTRSGYSFEGWTYGGNTYHGGDSITISKSTPTVTLTAVWNKYYRPGATLSISGGTEVWYSNNKTDGACHIMSDVENNTWTEMTTVDGDTDAQGNPPLILHDDDADSWYNQKKLGKTS